MGWLETLLVENLWPALLVWVLLYIADYAQTLRAARLHQEIGSKFIAIEGSYELNPYFQADINRLRKVSPRFLLMMLVAVGLMSVEWWLASQLGWLQLFSLLAGALILRSLMVNLQHLRNIASYRYVQRHPEQVSGKIEYRRQIMLWNQVVAFGSYALMFAALCAVTGSWFIAGGALGSLAIAGRMVLWHRKLVRAARPDFGSAPASR